MDANSSSPFPRKATKRTHKSSPTKYRHYKHQRDLLLLLTYIFKQALQGTTDTPTRQYLSLISQATAGSNHGRQNPNRHHFQPGNDTNEPAPTTVVIAGDGIVGLVLALALKKHCGIVSEIYEKADQFYEDVGAALGCYSNGLHVLRDIDPELLARVQDEGWSYDYRRWEKHDGTVIASANESVLSSEDLDLCSIGIRRWRLQKLLFKAVKRAKIPFHFKKGTKDVIIREDDLTEVVFEDGTSRLTKVLFAADGGKSAVRSLVKVQVLNKPVSRA